MPSSGGQTCALRSEEHTSELQSLTNLVCRLLLEKNICTCLVIILWIKPCECFWYHFICCLRRKKELANQNSRISWNRMSKNIFFRSGNRYAKSSRINVSSNIVVCNWQLPSTRKGCKFKFTGAGNELNSTAIRMNRKTCIGYCYFECTVCKTVPFV